MRDCGRTLYLNDQGIPFEELFSLDEPEEVTNGTFWVRRSLTEQGDGSSMVTEDLLSAELQALSTRIRVQTNKVFHRTLQEICDGMAQTSSFLTAMALAQPTETVRVMLDDPNLVTEAGNGFLELWLRTQIPVDRVSTQGQTSNCTRAIPINFTLNGNCSSSEEWNKGYLDPVTLVIIHYGTPTECTPTPIHLN